MERGNSEVNNFKKLEICEGTKNSFHVTDICMQKIFTVDLRMQKNAYFFFF